jgi:hypothetical protein
VNASDRFLTVPAASKFPEQFGLPKVPEGTLNKLRSVGGGPPFVRFGRRIGYPEDAYREWIFGRVSPVANSTSAFPRKPRVASTPELLAA